MGERKRKRARMREREEVEMKGDPKERRNLKRYFWKEKNNATLGYWSSVRYHAYLAFIIAGAMALIANTSASSGVLT